MRHGEEMLLVFAEGTPTAAARCSRPPSTDGGGRRCTCSARRRSPTTLLLRWHIKSERNEDLRDKFVQKYATLLDGYGFAPPDPDLRRDPETGRWVTGEIDWAPLRATLDNLGPDSARRIGDAARHWADTALGPRRPRARSRDEAA